MLNAPKDDKKSDYAGTFQSDSQPSIPVTIKAITTLFTFTLINQPQSHSPFIHHRKNQLNRDT